jgi:hypothetical protein
MEVQSLCKVETQSDTRQNAPAGIICYRTPKNRGTRRSPLASSVGRARAKAAIDSANRKTAGDESGMISSSADAGQDELQMRPSGFVYACITIRPGFRLASLEPPPAEPGGAPSYGDVLCGLDRLSAPSITSAPLAPGTHAFVRAIGESFLRVGVDAWPLSGCASGHGWLGRGLTVIAAGAFQVGAASHCVSD